MYQDPAPVFQLSPGGTFILPNHPTAPSSLWSSFTAIEENFYPRQPFKESQGRILIGQLQSGPLPAQSCGHGQNRQLPFRPLVQAERGAREDGWGEKRVFAVGEVASQMTVCPMHAMDYSWGSRRGTRNVPEVPLSLGSASDLASLETGEKLENPADADRPRPPPHAPFICDISQTDRS